MQGDERKLSLKTRGNVSMRTCSRCGWSLTVAHDHGS